MFTVEFWDLDIPLSHHFIPPFDKSVIVRQGFEAEFNLWQSRVVKKDHLILIGKALKVWILCQFQFQRRMEEQRDPANVNLE